MRPVLDSRDERGGVSLRRDSHDPSREDPRPGRLARADRAASRGQPHRGVPRGRARIGLHPGESLRMRSPLLTVFLKEMNETSRDWKALVITYGMPLVVYPILFVWMAEAVAVRTEKERGERYSYARVGPRASDVDTALAKLERFEEVKVASPERLESRVRDWSAAPAGSRPAAEGELRSALAELKIQALVLDSRAEARKIRILYDPSDGRSARAADLLLKRFQDQSERLFRGKLESLRLSVSDLYPLRAE